MQEGLSDNMSDTAFLSQQRENYQQEFLALRQNFERTGDGSAMIRRRATSVDALFKVVWKRSLAKDLDRPGAAVLATGGYGRRQLFPYSDIDLLYIFANEDAEREFREAVRACNQTLWDIGLSVSPAMRTLKECERADPDNLEFIVATLDRRFLTGDNALYRRFQAEVLPALLLREWSTLTQKLAEMARARHSKYSNTIFHLEPNIKECPGGLRDYQLAQWLILAASSAGPAKLAEGRYFDTAVWRQRRRIRLRLSRRYPMFPAFPPQSRRQHPRLACPG